MAMRDYNASVKSYNEAVKIQSNKTAALSGLISAYSALNDYSDASLAAGKLTGLDPKNKANWLKEGNLLQMSGSYNKSIAKFDGALALDPKYTDALYKKGVSVIAMGNLSGAVNLFDQVLAIDPRYKYAYNAKGLALEAEGKYSLALEAYNQSMKIDPAWSQPAVNKMHTLMALKRFKEAMTILVAS